MIYVYTVRTAEWRAGIINTISGVQTVYSFARTVDPVVGALIYFRFKAAVWSSGRNGKSQLSGRLLLLLLLLLRLILPLPRQKFLRSRQVTRRCAYCIRYTRVLAKKKNKTITTTSVDHLCSRFENDDVGSVTRVVTKLTIVWSVRRTIPRSNFIQYNTVS